MDGRLRGKRVAVVFIGSVDGRAGSVVEQAIGDALTAPAPRSSARVG